MLDRAMDEVAVREGCISQPQRVRLVDDALAHLGREEGDAELGREIAQHRAGGVAVGAGPDHHQRMPAAAERVRGRRNRLVVRQRTPDIRCGYQRHPAALVGDVLGQLQVTGAGTLLPSHPERLAHAVRDAVGGNDLPRELGERLHHPHHIDDLEMSLLAGLDRLLAGDHQHRHPAQLRIRGSRHQVGRTGAQGGQAHARPSGQPPVGGGHEAGRLLVARNDEANARLAQRLEQVQVLLAGNAEDVLDPLGFEGPDEEITGLHITSR